MATVRLRKPTPAWTNKQWSRSFVTTAGASAARHFYTNVYVSALTHQGLAARLLLLASEGAFALQISDAILDEIVERTGDSENRFVKSGMILVTCSGSVGRATLVGTPHEGILISHDLLRVEAKSERNWGWIYAYLHAPQTRAITKSAHYGHIIKHLETSHLDASYYDH